MLSLVKTLRRGIAGILFALFFSVSAVCQPISFLPVEDSMAAARTGSELTGDNTKPYRQSFSLGKHEDSGKNYWNFSTSDICAFILLAGIYVVMTKKSSKSRNATF